MNREEFEQYIISEYPRAFTTHFAAEMLSNILDYAELMPYEDRYSFLNDIIPEVSEDIIYAVNL